MVEYASTGQVRPGARVAPVKRRHTGRILLIILLALLVLLVAADRIGVVVAENTLASKARTQLAAQGVVLDGDPKVSISGFPFLTQVLSGEYDEIDMTVDHPAYQGVTLDTLTVKASGVHVPLGVITSGHGTVEADKVVGTGEISWGSFTQMIDLSALQQQGVDTSQLHITGTDSGDISITAPVTVAGQTVQATATGTISVHEDLVHVAITNVTSDAGGLAGLALKLAGIQHALNFDVRVPALPYSLKLDSVTSSASGVHIEASATNIVIAR